MPKQSSVNHFFFTEEIVTDSYRRKWSFYGEVSDNIIQHDLENLRLLDNSPSIYPEAMDVDSSNDFSNAICQNNDYKLNDDKNTHSKDNLFVSNSSLEAAQPLCISGLGKFLIFLAILTLVLALLHFVETKYYLYINPDKQLLQIKEQLKEMVLGQDKAIAVINHNLNDMLTHGIKLLAFVGTTGVGKTFTTNIIKSTYVPHLVQEIAFEDLANAYIHKDVISKFDISNVNIIIIDNLRTCDLDALSAFLKALPKNYKLLIIPIFNIHDTVNGISYTINTSDYDTIRSEIDTLQINFEIVVFCELQENVVKEWLKKKLLVKGVNLEKQDIIIKELLSQNHVKNKGFKELDAKLSLIKEL